MELTHRIQNKNIPWTEIRLHTGRTGRTDGDGVMQVTEIEANWLGKTPGWEPAGSMGSINLAKTAAPASTKPGVRPRVGAPVKPVKVAEPEPEPETEPEATADGVEEEATAAETEEEGPDLEEMTKSQLLEVAEQYDVKAPKDGKPLDKLLVEDLRKLLDKEIYGED